MRSKRTVFLPVFSLLAVAILCGIPLLLFSAAESPDTVLATMQKELQRASAALAKSDPALYFLSYSVADMDSASMLAANGSLVVSSHEQERQAAVTMRVGSPALDNTHGQSRPTGMSSGFLPLGDDPDATARPVATHQSRIRKGSPGLCAGQDSIRGAS